MPDGACPLTLKSKKYMRYEDVRKTILKAFPAIKELNRMQQEAMRCTKPALILLAPTGSGKTIAFAGRVAMSLPMRTLILTPSRELAQQVAQVVRAVTPGVKTVALYGGHAMQDEVNSLTPAPGIVVATPGRLVDHIKRGSVNLADYKGLVIDEYDKCLELGFEQQMRRIVKDMKGLRRLTLTSATRMEQLPAFIPAMDTEVLDFTDAAGEAPQGDIEVVEVESFLPDKLDTLSALLRTIQADGRTVVFVNHRESAQRVYDRMKREGFAVGLYHGALEQHDRENALEMFANGTTPILISTDLASRGLDIPQVEGVVHYHLPPSEQTWTHRIGRTGRQGTSGTVYVIVSEQDNVPEYIHFDRSAQPAGDNEPASAKVATLYLNLGKKDKVSRGDILGYLTGPGNLSGQEVGRIQVRDHCALAAIPADKAGKTLAALSQAKIKGKRVKASLLR